MRMYLGAIHKNFKYYKRQVPFNQESSVQTMPHNSGIIKTFKQMIRKGIHLSEIIKELINMLRLHNDISMSLKFSGSLVTS